MIDLFFIFCIYSVLGWIVEIVFYLFKTKRILKRGILSGPYCILYGISIATCTVLTNNINNLFLEFILCSVICTIYELIAGIIIKKALHRTMWDYTGERFNIGGYICLKFSLIWGVLAIVSVNFINPFILASDQITQFIASVGILSFITLDSLTLIRE